MRVRYSFTLGLFLTIGLSCSPLSLEIVNKQSGSVDYVTRSCVNLVDASRVVVGKSIADDGTLVEALDNQSKVTNLLPVYLGELWYQKVKYLHACCERNSLYDFQAEVVTFYDSSGKCIKQEKEVTSAVRIPDGARLARVQYRASDELLFVSTTNRSVMSPYSAYDKGKLVAEQKSFFQEVNNSDDSITHLLRNGYDFLDRGFGYGSLHTAYNSDCIQAEAYNNHYSGKKWQIDCSSFVELALTGTRFENSRYYRGSEFENLTESDSFCFDENTEYNYDMIQFPEECGADYGRLYANKIAKFFYDRGYLYVVEPGFANVQIGDLLFWGNGSNSDRFFYGVGHVAICSDVWPKKNGGNGVRVLETAYERVQEYSYDIRFGARPLLPPRKTVCDSPELIKEVFMTNSTFSISAGESTCVATLSLREDLQLRDVYTLAFACDLPEGVTVICRNEVDKKAIGGEDVDELYPNNGIILKHFGVGQEMLGKDKNVVKVYLFSKESVTGTFKLNGVSLKKGFYREMVL